MASNSNSKDDIYISKSMTYLLRHGAQKEGLIMSKDGFVRLDELLKHRSLANKAKVDDVLRIVENCSKKRFHIEYRNDDGEGDGEKKVIYIRANQGHSIQDVEIDLVKINEKLDQCLHGTYLKFWDSIKTQVSAGNYI